MVISAAFCGLMANQFASRERKLNLPGSAPAAVTVNRPAPRVVPSPAPAAQPAPPVPTPTTTTIAKPLTPDPSPGRGEGGKKFLPHPDKPWVEIDSESARELYERGVLFIDARRTSVYEEGHIAGARSIPVWESDLDDRLNALYEEGLDPEAPFVVYCSGGDCEDSHMLSQRLWGIGFNNVLVYKDGYPDWVKNRGPIETGPAKR